MEIVWEEPPAAVVRAQGRAGKYLAFAEALRDHQGRWALLPLEDGEERAPKGAKNTAQNIRRGVVKGFAKGQFETIADGGKVYVRFVGEADASSSEPDEPAVDPGGETVDERRARLEEESGFAPKVRRWAAVKGIPVADRGRLPQSLIRDFCAETNTPLPHGLSVVG